MNKYKYVSLSDNLKGLVVEEDDMWGHSKRKTMSFAAASAEDMNELAKCIPPEVVSKKLFDEYSQSLEFSTSLTKEQVENFVAGKVMLFRKMLLKASERRAKHISSALCSQEFDPKNGIEVKDIRAEINNDGAIEDLWVEFKLGNVPFTYNYNNLYDIEQMATISMLDRKIFDGKLVKFLSAPVEREKTDAKAFRVSLLGEPDRYLAVKTSDKADDFLEDLKIENNHIHSYVYDMLVNEAAPGADE